MLFSSGSFSEVPFSDTGGIRYSSTLTESATGSDSISARTTFLSSVTEAASGLDQNSALVTFLSSVLEVSTGADTEIGRAHV